MEEENKQQQHAAHRLQSCQIWCLAAGSTVQQVLPADFSAKSQSRERGGGFEKEQQIHTLMCSSQCVDSKLDNQ